MTEETQENKSSDKEGAITSLVSCLQYSYIVESAQLQENTNKSLIHILDNFDASNCHDTDKILEMMMRLFQMGDSVSSEVLIKAA